MNNSMESLNRERILCKILKELSAELNVEISFLCSDWIIKLRRGELCGYIYGYDWGLNSATAQLIAKDKEATYEILTIAQVRAIEHKLFFNYNLQVNYTGQDGCWADIMQYAQLHWENNKYNLLCKPNKGTGGNDIYKITTQWDLENAIHKMFSKYRDLCLCPFYEIEKEYRLIVLGGEILLVYSKERPYVIGNGKDTLLALVIDKYGEQTLTYLENIKEEQQKVLLKDEVKSISWKHNLGKGSNALIIENKELKFVLGQMACKAMDALGLVFASVDIVLIGGEYYIMEINSGVMMENFARQASDYNYDYYNIAKCIYKQAIQYYLKK